MEANPNPLSPCASQASTREWRRVMASASLNSAPPPAPSVSLRRTLRCRCSSDPTPSAATGQFSIAAPQLQMNTNNVTSTEKIEKNTSTTGGAFYFKGSTTSLVTELLPCTKVTLVRHGLSLWNDESRVQGSSDLSILTDTGAKQAEKWRDALSIIRFTRASPVLSHVQSPQLNYYGVGESNRWFSLTH